MNNECKKKLCFQLNCKWTTCKLINVTYSHMGYQENLTIHADFQIKNKNKIMILLIILTVLFVMFSTFYEFKGFIKVCISKFRLLI